MIRPRLWRGQPNVELHNMTARERYEQPSKGNVIVADVSNLGDPKVIRKAKCSLTEMRELSKFSNR